jgi:hypothetical protein
VSRGFSVLSSLRCVFPASLPCLVHCSALLWLSAVLLPIAVCFCIHLRDWITRRLIDTR